MIQNIWAVGRNYLEHARELGNQAPDAAQDPMIFLKAGSSIVQNEGHFFLPEFSTDVHYECELALQFGPTLNFENMTLALDLTARDVQSKLKAAGQPWTLAKSFKGSCPIGPLIKISGDLSLIRFSFRVNGEIRQTGQTSDMIHPVEKLRDYVVNRFPVVSGDLLLTGTPKGVGRLKAGDRLEGEIEGVMKTAWTVNR